jgi:hypothetical protein
MLTSSTRKREHTLKACLNTSIISRFLKLRFVPPPLTNQEDFVITSTPLKSRITNKISDESGRWAGNVIIFKNSQKISLISTYQTVKYQSPGTTSINAQQTAWLASNNRLIDPITGYQNDLILLLNNL